MPARKLDPRLPAEPPFRLGARVVYPGPDFCRGERGSEGPWVRAGDIGTVVANHPGSPRVGDIDVLHGWSVVEYHGDPRAHIAVDAFTVAGLDYEGRPLERPRRFEVIGHIPPKCKLAARRRAERG